MRTNNEETQNGRPNEYTSRSVLLKDLLDKFF